MEMTAAVLYVAPVPVLSTFATAAPASANRNVLKRSVDQTVAAATAANASEGGCARILRASACQSLRPSAAGRMLAGWTVVAYPVVLPLCAPLVAPVGNVKTARLTALANSVAPTVVEGVAAIVPDPRTCVRQDCASVSQSAPG